MDPLAHTFAGAALASSGLRRLTPLATATLVIGANLPDVDAITYAMDRDLSLAVRRGWTHGVLAMGVWPLALAGLLFAFDRLVRARWIATRSGGHGAGAAGRARFPALLLLSAVSVLSHPALDWFNAYGIRLLMPFDDRWFYGDTLFIVDPWIWLLAGTAAAVGTARGATGVVLWAVVALATTGLVFSTPAAPAPVLAAWIAGMAAAVVLCVRARDGRRSASTAKVLLCVVLCYAAAMRTGSARAAGQAGRWLDAAGLDVLEIAALPVLANPLVRDVIARDARRYHFLRVRWPSGAVAVSGPSAPIGGPTPVTEAALDAPGVHGLRVWMRFPSYEVVAIEDGYRVFIRDVRFWRPGGPRGNGFGRGVVELDASLRPRTPSTAAHRLERPAGLPFASGHGCVAELARHRPADFSRGL